MLCEYVTPSRLARARSVVEEDRFTVTEFLRNQRLSLFTKSIAPDRDNCQTVALIFHRREYLKTDPSQPCCFALLSPLVPRQAHTVPVMKVCHPDAMLTDVQSLLWLTNVTSLVE
jgi:hypothetical protein